MITITMGGKGLDYMCELDAVLGEGRGGFNNTPVPMVELATFHSDGVQYTSPQCLVVELATSHGDRVSLEQTLYQSQVPTVKE